MGRWQDTAERVNFDPASTDSDRFTPQAYNKDYFAYDPNANQYMRRQLKALADKYAIQNNQVAAESGGATGGQGAMGSLGQYSQAVRSDMPQSTETADVYGQDYTRRSESDIEQTGAQRDWTQQARDLAMQQALAEQTGAMNTFQNKEALKTGKAKQNAEATSDVFKEIGRTYQSYGSKK